MSNAKELTAIKIPQALEFQQARIDILQEMVKEREDLLSEILAAVRAYDESRPAWLPGDLVEKIQKALGA